MDKKQWIMPEWMEPYRKLIGETGGNPIEELMNDHSTNSFNNIIRAGLIVCVSGQIGLLIRLNANGLLKKPKEVPLTYDIDFSGENAAGLRPFTDTIAITVESGDPGGDDGEFAEFMRQSLREWFDGSGVELRKAL